MTVKKIFAVEVSGACNLDTFCQWCPMYARPRSRKRGIMSDETFKRALYWVEKLPKVELLALHNFGEPLLHPKFDEIAKEFSRVTKVTMSTNAVLLDEKWADRLSRVDWEYITISNWKSESAAKAAALLKERGVRMMFPAGVTHNWAGQSSVGPGGKLFFGCHFLEKATPVIRWDGSLVSCCVTDREEDSIGTVFEDVEKIEMRGYSLCASCHHAR